MATVSVNNISRNSVTIGGDIGEVRPGSVREVTLTGPQLEAVGADLTHLQDAGVIVFTVTNDASQDDRTEIAMAGLNRQTLSGWAEVTAASQTNNVVARGLGTAWVAPRAGSITGFSASLSVAVTGAAVNARVAVNGTAVADTALVFSVAGAETEAYAVFAPGAITFAAGDKLSVVYTTLVTTNTPTLAADIEIAN